MEEEVKKIKPDMRALDLVSKELDLESIKFSYKSGRINSLLEVIKTLSSQYVADKDLKNEVTNRAATLLKKELEDF